MACSGMLGDGIAVNANFDNTGNLRSRQVLFVLWWELDTSEHPVIKRGRQQLFTLLFHLGQEGSGRPFQDALNTAFW